MSVATIHVKGTPPGVLGGAPLGSSCGTLPGRISWSTSLAIFASVFFATGSTLLIMHAAAARPDIYSARAGLLMMIAACVQAAVQRSVSQRIAARNMARSRVSAFVRSKTFFRTLLVGAIVTYVAALCRGSQPGIVGDYFAALGVWFTIQMLPLSADPKLLDRWRQWIQARGARRIGGAVYMVLLGLVYVELMLRAASFFDDGNWLSRLSEQASLLGASATPAAAVADELAQREQSKSLRVAVLSGATLFDDGVREDYLSQLECAVPGIEARHFRATERGSHEFSGKLFDRAVASKPDLLLAVVSVGDDVLTESRTYDFFDWRSVRICQVARGWFGCDESDESNGAAVEAHDFLKQAGAKLAVCRTPMDSDTRLRWQDTLGHLAQLAARCERRGLPLALVVAPSDFQVNPVLCETLRRRVGYEKQQLDIELPQRKLAVFAAEKNLPSLDLLPCLGASADALYARNSSGLSDQGSAVAARAIGEWLQARYRNQTFPSSQLSRNDLQQPRMR